MIKIITNNLNLNECKELISFINRLKNIDHSVHIESVKNSTEFIITLKEV